MRFEIDIPDNGHALPVGTTGEASIDVGDEQPASRFPSYAARVGAA